MSIQLAAGSLRDRFARAAVLIHNAANPL
jgi:hypothetical protein